MQSEPFPGITQTVCMGCKFFSFLEALVVHKHQSLDHTPTEGDNLKKRKLSEYGKKIIRQISGSFHIFLSPGALEGKNTVLESV